MDIYYLSTLEKSRFWSYDNLAAKESSGENFTPIVFLRLIVTRLNKLITPAGSQQYQVQLHT